MIKSLYVRRKKLQRGRQIEQQKKLKIFHHAYDSVPLNKSFQPLASNPGKSPEHMASNARSA
jgi:hypothetical protein